MAKINSLTGFEGMYKMTSQFANILKDFNMQSHRCLVDNLATSVSAKGTIADIVGRETRLLNSLNIPLHDYHNAADLIAKRWDTIAAIERSFKTPAISALEKSLLQNDFSALQSFANSLSTYKVIEAPNLALLKMARVFDDMMLPKGLTTVIKGLHMDSAKKLIRSESVSFDTTTKMFYVEAFPADTATVSETNILCSSLDLLSELDEAQLISFLNYLENNYSFAHTHNTGKKIAEVISSWNNFIDFDYDYFYHARSLSEGRTPYSAEELKKAPIGYTGHGRYNYAGQSHYYFSNMQKGAILEVSKHSNDPRIQIARLKPARSIKMIDLSEEITTQNKFLEYCRLKPSSDPNRKIKREYLLPCYVADCCHHYKIDGIKYYGSKEYKNYVSWEDNYFEFVDDEIREMN